MHEGKAGRFASTGCPIRQQQPSIIIMYIVLSEKERAGEEGE